MSLIIPSSESDRKKIFSAIKEISDSMTRIAAERDLMKDIIDNLKEEFELPTKPLRKLARVYHEQNLTAVQTENEELEELYAAVCEQ